MIDKVKRYLDMVYRQQERLAKSRRLDRFAGAKALDLPGLPAGELAAWYRNIRAAGYDGANIGLTSLWNRDDLRLALAGMQILSAHGTSVKWQLKTGSPYRSAVLNDKKILDLIDPEEAVPVNYDLFAGNLFTEWPENFREAEKINAREIARRLGLSGTDPEAVVTSYIINEIKAVFGASRRQVLFELPGTRGWSIFPSPASMTRAALRASELYPHAGICIDAGHLLTWKTARTGVNGLVDAVKPVADRIRMFHLSSAGSDLTEFRDAYEAYLGHALPAWHREGLDLMLAVHEDDMLDLVRGLRILTGGHVLEVCETRRPQTAVADYFPRISPDQIDNSPYLPSLKLQAKLLGYRP